VSAPSHSKHLADDETNAVDAVASSMPGVAAAEYVTAAVLWAVPLKYRSKTMNAPASHRVLVDEPGSS
jgi:hypothetical protein